VKSKITTGILGATLAFNCLAAPVFPEEGDRGKIKVEVKDWDWQDASKEKWRWCEALCVDSLGYIPADTDKVNRYGSLADGPKLKATGFFRTEKYKGRWFLVDPEGCLHIDAAVIAINPGSGPTQRKNFKEKFNSDRDAWFDYTARQLRELGFNGSGAWSSEDDIRFFNDYHEDIKFSYCPIINPMSDYAYSIGVASHNPGNTAYPNRCIRVFDPQFKEYCEKRIPEFVARYRDDPNVIGYFTDNEMPLLLSNLYGYLTLPEGDYGRAAAEEWLKSRGLSKDHITDEVKREFAGYVAEQYFRIVSETLKKYDPNHLYLGSRYTGTSKYIKEVYQACAKYCDIVSINYYGFFEVRNQDILQWEEWADTPWMVTEFYSKGEDSGLSNRTGAGWLVHTQKDRGLHYENFIIGLLRSNKCVGWNWLKYQDNDPTDANAEASNLDSNKGLLNNRYETYDDLVRSMQKINKIRYGLIVRQ